MLKEKIPVTIIKLLINVIPPHHTHEEINIIFQRACAPNEIPAGSRKSKVSVWLNAVNAKCENPLHVLGKIIEEFMDGEFIGDYYKNYTQEEIAEEKEKIKEDQTKITKALYKDKLVYSRGGHINKIETISVASLQDIVKERGLGGVNAEIERILRTVEKDPMAAVHYSASLIEASLKLYLDHYKIEYQENSDRLRKLWEKFINHIRMSPKELDNEDLRKIVSGLYSVVDGTMHLRNKKSAAHGKSEKQFRSNTICPRHARLGIHAAHTISLYVVELMITPTETQLA